MNRKSIIQFLFQAVLMVVVAALIVLFMPREQTFSYDYTVGKPWKYGQIIASYDFPIYKSDELVRAQRDSVRHLYQPYYNMDASVGEVQLRNLKSDYAAGKMDKVPAAYINYIAKCLKEIYHTGIIDNSDYSLLLDSGVNDIRVVSGTTAVIRAVKNLYTTRSAYLHIFMADTVHFRHELLSLCNVNNYLGTNLEEDKQKSHGMMQDLLSSVSLASGMVQSGQKIIDRGDIVTHQTESILDSMKKEGIKRHDDASKERWLMLGQFLFVMMLLCLFTCYLKMFRPDYLHSPQAMFLLYSLITIFPIATSLVEYQTTQSAYLIPYAMVPMFVRIFMDARTAFITHIITILLSSVSVHGPYEFVLVQFLAGVVAIFSIKELSSRSQLIRAALLITLMSLLFMFGYDLSQGLTPQTFDPSWYICLCINGVLLLFAYPIMYLFEKLFGFTSSVTLIELSNVNTPLLRQMSKVAQGTFNHSMQVANLATEVAAKIGAKVELVRTGALYHDIGKMKNPAFFTENQSGVNPHDSLSEERSAQIIIQHVPDGLEMADKHHLPAVIKGFIATHHGRSKTKYFYINYINKHPGEPVNEELFTYPGPNPSTLEQAILMMADSVEAASRSLKTINDDTLRDLVNKIVDDQVKEGYFRDCPITFHDIKVAKEQFISSLKTIYHTRISYPELKSKETKTEEHASIFGNYRNWNHTRRDRRQQRQTRKS